MLNDDKYHMLYDIRIWIVVISSGALLGFLLLSYPR